MDTKELGNLGEGLACGYLVKNGYKILGRNYRINFGEIDIIAKKRFRLFRKSDETIHFVEVKSLNNASGDFSPEQRVDYRKQNKYRKLAEIWLSVNKFPENTPYQVDIVSILVNDGKIDYFKNVVSENA